MTVRTSIIAACAICAAGPGLALSTAQEEAVDMLATLTIAERLCTVQVNWGAYSSSYSSDAVGSEAAHERYEAGIETQSAEARENLAGYCAGVSAEYGTFLIQ